MDRVVLLLSKTQLIENAGFSIRASANFGCADVRLINPRFPISEERLNAISCLEDRQLVSLSVFDSFEAAVSDMTAIISVTARSRTLRIEEIAMSDLPQEISKFSTNGQKLGLLFGPENSGLTNDEVSFSNYFLQIPTSQNFPSMNLSHAVSVVLYECSKKRDAYLGHKRTEELEPLASKADLVNLLRRIEGLHKKRDTSNPNVMLNLRQTFGRFKLSRQEVASIHGLISSLTSGRLENS